MSEPVHELLDSLLDRQRQALIAGRRPTIESLLDGSPFANDPDAQLDLLYNEVVVREEMGAAPTLEEYVARYPHLEPDLRVHFEIHRAVNGSLLEVTETPEDLDTWPGATADSQRPRSRLGRYEIIQQIGQGGMGVVYRARDPKLQRDVALKVFQPGRLPTDREAMRFQAEAESLARLTHPNIVHIFEVGESDGSPFLALELIEGATLADRLQETIMAPREAARLIETLARAVHHAHEQQVIHRDLKPANILFTRDGTPKITDFGLAKLLNDDFHSARDATRTGEPLGTPRYMAPEQASGQVDQISAATDVYSLGTLLYECLTGRAPFVAQSVVETLQRIRMEEPVPPRRWQRSIPRDLQTICLKCLQKLPGRRYATANDLAADLQRFLQGKPIQARPVSTAERTWKWCRRYPAHAALIALGVVLSVSSLAVFTIGRRAEARRIDRLRSDVAELIGQGQQLLEQGEVDLAHGRFQEAWMTVQAEPALADHGPGVGGWLDHSRRALHKEQWKQRTPPREFDERRDLALLDSLLLDPQPKAPIASAREAIHAALELTIPGDPAWQAQRERLTLVDAELVRREQSSERSLELLPANAEFGSRLFHLQRAELLTQLARPAEAQAAHDQALQFPPDQPTSLMFHAMNHLRQRDFKGALGDLEELLNLEPEQYLARLFQAICFLNLQRPAEARVALTACIAQRPGLYCGYYYRSLADLALGDRRQAIRDFERVLELNPSEPVRNAVTQLLDDVRSTPVTQPAN